MINEMLKYQEIDAELYNLEKNLKESDERRSYGKYYRIVQDATEQLQKLEREAEDLNKTYKHIADSNAELSAEIKALIDASENVKGDMNELDYYFRNVDKLTAQLGEFEIELNRIHAHIEDVKINYEDLMKKGRQASDKAKQAKIAYIELENANITRINEIKAELGKIEPKLPTEALATYKQVREARKLPAFVSLNGDCCGGCGMNLASDALVSLKASGDYVECPNCQRIIYVI